MEISLLFLCIVSMLQQGILSEIRLDQFGGERVKPGESIRLNCAVYGAVIRDGYTWNWIRKPPNKGLEWIGRGYYNGPTWHTDYASAFRSRVSISTDASKNQFSFQLSSVAVADTATYFCARKSYAYFDYWGQGTFVTVTTVPQGAPSLFPLIQTSERVSRDGLITVGCLAKDVVPQVTSFSWNDQNNVSVNANYIRQFTSVFNPNGTFTSSSQVVISASDFWDFVPFYCKATNTAGTSVARIARQTSCQEPEMIIRAPRVEDFESSDPNATIFCMAVNLHSESTTIQWLKNGQVIKSGFDTTGPVAAGRSGYSIMSELTVDKRDWVSDKKFSCEVHSETFNSIKNISKSLVCDLGPSVEVNVHVETIPPTFTDIYLTQSAKMTCRISNLPYDQNLTDLVVTWTRASDNKQLDTIQGSLQAQPNNEFGFVEATATVCPEEWNSGQTFNCKVTFPSVLPTAETKPLKKLKEGTPHAPAVYVLPPPSEQLILRETATVTCLIKGFYPNDFFVKWLRNDEPVLDSEYHTGAPLKESKTPETYFAYSTLNVNEQDWSYGAIYTCVVGHEELPLQTTQKTIDKNTGKPTLVNVSLVLSETAQSCN